MSEYTHDEAMRDLDSAIKTAPFGPVQNERARIVAYITRIEAERDEALLVAKWLADPENVCVGYTQQENIERAIEAVRSSHE